MARVQVGFQDSSTTRLRQQAHGDAEPREQGRHGVAKERRLERACNLGDTALISFFNFSGRLEAASGLPPDRIPEGAKFAEARNS